MNNIEKAKNKVNCAKINAPSCIYQITPDNITIDVGNTYTVNSNQKANVKNVGNHKNAMLEFYIPKGSDGNGDKIKVGITKSINFNEEALVEDVYKDGVHTLNFYIPRGNPGDAILQMAYIVTFEDNYPKEGYVVENLGKLPLTRIELDTSGIIFLENDLVKFKKIGYYKVTFVARAYVKVLDVFDESKDFVALGFKEKDTDNVYIGGTSFITGNNSRTIFGQGILSVYDTNKLYELVNLSNQNIYLKTPDLQNISSDSYFVNAPVSIIIEYIGKSAN